jgi:4-amino-4-deoxy-L-arabinose transferase-like glycosyltransferase
MSAMAAVSPAASADAAATDRDRPFERWLTGGVLFLCAIAFFIDLARTPLFDVDEGAFAQTTIEMFQRGDFLSPHLNGRPRADKPVLTYWLQAASVRLFGINEFALRFPSALCGLGWILLTGRFTARRFGARAGWLAATMLALSLGVTTMTRAATADALLNLLIAASMFAAWTCLETGRRAWLYVATVCTALGFLTKGPVAVVIPLVTSGVFCALHGRTREWLRRIFDPVALGLFLAIAAPWFALLVSRDGWGFVTGFFGRHNLERFTHPLQGHGGALWYYVPFALAATLPFTACAVPVIRRLRGIWRDEAQCYLLLWFATVMVVFSAAATKLPHYVLYGMTGPFVLMAIHAPALRSRVGALAPAALLLVALSVLPAALARAASGVSNDDVRSMLAAAAASVPRGYYVCMATGIVATLWLMIDARISLSRSLVVAAALTAVALHGFVAPILAGARQVPIKQAARFAREHQYEVVMWRLNAPSFSVYYGRPVALRTPRAGDVVLTTEAALGRPAPVNVHPLFVKDGIVLAAIAK